MKLLYFSWGELTQIDCLNNLRPIAEVVLLEYPKEHISQTAKIEALLNKYYQTSSFEAVFSFNFFPVIAKFCYFQKIPYICYVFDSPLQAFENEWVYSPYNYLFLFDSIQCETQKKKGLPHVYYQPLSIDKSRMEALCQTPPCYKDDISFMGCMYNDEKDFFSQIKGISSKTKKHIDDSIEKQQQEQGLKILQDALDEETLQELTSLISLDLNSSYQLSKEQLIHNSLYRTCTARERTNLVKKVAKNFPISLYTYSDVDEIKNMPNLKLPGPLDYMTTMPETFRNSKINLNFSLRSIQAGIPLRIIDILGAGGFVITNYQKDLEKHFENKKDLVWYHTPEELLELLAYYLEHDEEREEIAKNGHEKALSLFSYDVQLPQILNTVLQNPVKEHATTSLPISVCLIGKNEEKHVDACLKPWHDLGFEIIVADTGSSDKTMELARKYTNSVFYRPWTNHFADARNSAAAWARNPYILAVDFDEYLTQIDTDKLKAALNPERVGVYCLHNPNPNNMDEQIMLEYIGRLYHKDFCHYKGRIHEQIHPLDGSPSTFYQVPVTLKHVGYSKPETTKEKATRNLKLLLLDLEEHGPDPYTYFQIGQSYRILRDLDKALEYYDLGLSMEVEPELDYVQTMVESYGYCLLEKGDIETALQLENIYDTFCVRADFVFLMGLIYMNATFFDEAIAQFEKATTIKKYATVGTNSFLAWYNAGVICEVCGLTQEAHTYYQKCGDYEPALNRLKQFTSTPKK